MGAEQVATALPPLLRAVKLAGHPVIWASDPMHANTFTHATGYKTRRFDDIMTELHGFFAACRQADIWPGGVHVELTGENVTECLGGGADEVLDDHLERRYETMCDPRLNARQSLELAFEVAELLRS
jgi:3-deoxy-7-phosphoheptulonate synthase